MLHCRLVFLITTKPQMKTNFCQVDSDNEKGSDGYYCERSGEPSNCEGSEAVDISVFLSCNYLFIN